MRARAVEDTRRVALDDREGAEGRIGRARQIEHRRAAQLGPGDEPAGQAAALDAEVRRALEHERLPQHVLTGQQAQAAAASSQHPADGARHVLTRSDSDAAAGRGVGEWMEDPAAVLDVVFVVPDPTARAPAQHAKRDPVAVRALRRLVVDQDLWVADVARADRERPVVPGQGGTGALELQPDAVAELDGSAGGEVAHRAQVVPEPEEVLAPRGARDGAEHVLGEVKLLVAREHGAPAVHQAPFLGEVGGALRVGGSRLRRPLRPGLERLEVEGLLPRAQYRLAVRADRQLARHRVERPAAGEPSVRPRPLEHRAARRDLGDLDAVEVVLEPAVPAPLHDRAVPLADLDRRERDGQSPAGGAVVAQPVAEIVAALSGAEPQQPEGEAVPDPLRGVDPAECRLDQALRDLEAVERLSPELEHDGVARARGARRDPVRGCGEVGRLPPLGRVLVCVGRAQVGEQSSRPHLTRVDLEADLAVGDDRLHYAQSVRVTRRDSGRELADDRTGGRPLPAVADRGLLVPVLVGEDPALLVQHTVDVGLLVETVA